MVFFICNSEAEGVYSYCTYPRIELNCGNRYSHLFDMQRESEFLNTFINILSENVQISGGV